MSSKYFLREEEALHHVTDELRNFVSKFPDSYPDMKLSGSEYFKQFEIWVKILRMSRHLEVPIGDECVSYWLSEIEMPLRSLFAREDDSDALILGRPY